MYLLRIEMKNGKWKNCKHFIKMEIFTILYFYVTTLKIKKVKIMRQCLSSNIQHLFNLIHLKVDFFEIIKHEFQWV